ncbi:hypothetical protein PMAYCL1PPCAC_13859 [Pristionchus mayeri]|uniref:Cullin N-terminal domain-containing protein n=1 Tax=Pristionchus mayeri TaxID=1317129 RepID=A0AAN4ZQR4_9BILA|nr:hypothetical protein PMAYCL1PPCAC_13859 [Pristionchus mayeri]
MNEAKTFLQANSIQEYLDRVERRLSEEKERCETYLHPSSLQPLKRKCEEILIAKRIDLFEGGQRFLLDEYKYEDLDRMYKLCERVEGGLEPLRNSLEADILKQNPNALEKAKEQADSDPKTYLLTLLEMHKSVFNH